VKKPLQILYEDNHCLAVWKPAGAATTHYQGRAETLDRQAKRYLKEKFQKPGNVFLGIVHRLDQPVTGVALFARTSKAAARLARQFREGRINKVYWAIIEGIASPARGAWIDWLQKDPKTKRVVAGAKRAAGAREARTDYEVRAVQGGLCWLELCPRTGRKHQLRVQLAQRGYPVYGDKKYGSQNSLGGSIALHARALTFIHPIRGEPITLTAELPTIWRQRFSAFFHDDS
jgi:23S rRNA pseudouridine1911/1915/1917 synthase